jgi:hypothetical protein
VDGSTTILHDSLSRVSNGGTAGPLENRIVVVQDVVRFRFVLPLALDGVDDFLDCKAAGQTSASRHHGRFGRNNFLQFSYPVSTGAGNEFARPCACQLECHLANNNKCSKKR